VARVGTVGVASVGKPGGCGQELHTRVAVVEPSRSVEQHWLERRGELPHVAPASGGGGGRAPASGRRRGEPRQSSTWRRGRAPPAAQMSSAHRAGDAAGCGSAFPIAAEAEEAVWGGMANAGGGDRRRGYA